MGEKAEARKVVKEIVTKALSKTTADGKRAVKKADLYRSVCSLNFSERQVGEVFGIHAKTVQASKVDFSTKGKAEWGKGTRVHLPLKNVLHLNAVDLGKFKKAVKTLVGEPAHRPAPAPKTAKAVVETETAPEAVTA